MEVPLQFELIPQDSESSVLTITLSLYIYIYLVCKGNITLKYMISYWEWSWDHSGNLSDLTLECVHADGAEHLLLAL